MTATTSQDLEPDLSGYVIDRYQLLRCLGVGGMGAVYEAEHTALGKRVAIKLLRQQHAMHEISRKRFLREARAATRVEHPHVVDVSDFGETADGRVYFAMELLAGRDLRELLDVEGRLPWARARELLTQIASALGAAHGQGVVHRDMKPSNCFLVDVPGLEGRDFVKVLDYGIAKLTGKHGEPTQALTSTDEVFGTVGYMAPEMAMGISDDPRSDVYAVGVMMYRMLVGELPFDGGTAYQILSRHVSEPPVPPRARVPEIPEGVERIILTAMAKRPEARFASMQAFGDALRRGDVDPHVTAPPAATERLAGASSQERVLVGRTASLTAGRIGSGPWPSIGPTEVIAVDDAHPSRPLPRAAKVTASRPVVGGPFDEVEHAVLEPGVGKSRLSFVVATLLGMVVTLTTVVVVAVIAPASGGAPADPVIVPTPVEPSDREQEPIRIAPGLDERTDEPPAQPPERTARIDDDEPEPPADHEPAPLQPPPAASSAGGNGRARTPRTDAAVAARIERKLRARCRVDGRTSVQIEGIIATSGKVLSPLVTPAQGPGACARKVVTATPFASGSRMRPMPVLSVEL